MLFQENDTLKEKFRKVAKIEGYSFLILLFIAIPLKYGIGLAIATKIVGPIHGALWTWFLILQYQASKEEKWGVGFNLFAFIMSLIPFGTFWLSSKLKEKN